MKKLSLILLTAASFGFLINCDFDPKSIRVHIDGETFKPVYVDELEFSSAYYGIAVGEESGAYILGSAGPGFTHVFTRQVDDNWVEVGHSITGETRPFGQRLPGSTSVYFADCSSFSYGYSMLGEPDYPFRLLLFRNSEMPVNVSETVWGGVRASDFEAAQNIQCGLKWGLEPNGTLLVSDGVSLSRVRDGQIEVVIADLRASMRRPENCRIAVPDIRVGDGGEVLLFSTVGCPPPWDESQLSAFMLANGELEPIPLERLRWIDDAAIGPDGAAYFIYTREPEDVDGIPFETVGVKARGDERSEFLKGKFEFSVDPQMLTFDSSGDMYLIVDQGGKGVSDKTWLVKFETGRMFMVN